MQQSSVIAFFLLGGFVVYITIKGELPSYAGILGIGPKAGSGLSETVAAGKQYGSGLLSGLESAITH